MAKFGKVKQLFTHISKDASRLFWGILFGVVTAFTIIVIGKSIISVVRSQIEIYRLNRQKRALIEQIEQDSTTIHRLPYDDYFEQYARERYNLQQKGEKVYIVE